MRFWFCFIYLCFVGAASFFLGRLIPKSWLDPYSFPFRGFACEKGGRIYDKIGIRHWQTRVPDMSRIFKKLMPPKSLTGDIKQRLPELIRETCVAELILAGNCVAGLYCLRIWPGVGGIIVTLLFAFVFNIPYILIQRFNRPRLIKLARRMHKEDAVAEQEAEAPVHV